MPKNKTNQILTMQEVLTSATKEYRRKRSSISPRHMAAIDLLSAFVQAEALVGVPAGVLARHISRTAVKAVEQNLKFEKEKYEKAKNTNSI